ncbi:MAG: methyltransferase domain-containing protein [Methanocellales archaeon]|nr:methyltransferase domain-containing protein [Methanocellales archaeon]
MLPGVKVYDIKKIPDERGFFAELLRLDWSSFLEDDNIVQVNLSMSYPGIIRAWHRHSRGQVDYLCVVGGALKVCAYDDRESSKTKGQLDEIILTDEKPQIVRIPGFYWHGTKGMGNEPSLVLYLTTKLYDYRNPDEERRPWSDSSIIDPRTGEPYDWNKTPHMDRAKHGDIILRMVCRVCGSKKLHKFLSLGPTPLANKFLRENQLGSPEVFYPLDVYFCSNCYLVQLLDVISPKVMFEEYVYLTGASKPMQIHFSGLAEDVIQSFRPSENSLVVDIGSNDGTLLQCFSKFGLRTLGIEPATNIARLAEAKGIQTVNDFFDEECAMKLHKEYGQANVILATNVFAHVDDLESFLRGINHLLSNDGIFIIEVPYLLNLLNNMEFDTIYHEHLSYFAVHPLVYLFRKFGMEVVDVKQVPVHGGSIRVFVQRSAKQQSQNVAKLLLMEREAKLDSLKTYLKFADEVALLKEKLVRLLKVLKKEGARITGYGAPAKGNILLNYCNIGTDVLDYITDTTPFKQGCYTPGMHIPVFPEKKFHEEPPNYALLLAWNYADEILQKESEYRQKGGKFILPIPEPKVI